ncbi:MAG: hypothetical protein ACRC9O_10185, partial [Plesiomonas sp.]|uniref:hypothetical protein n=1 Tax=Plesiomonas sp. TaxID=2486279 RepID=UPI003F3CF229
VFCDVKRISSDSDSLRKNSKELSGNAQIRVDQIVFETLKGVTGHTLDCSGQVKLNAVLELTQYRYSDSLGVSLPLY